MSGADLSYDELNHVDLNNANLSGADLSDAKLNHVDFSNADLSGADLRRFNFRHFSELKNLKRLKLREIVIQQVFRFNGGGAKFVNANLRDAKFADVDFSRVKLNGADIKNTDFSNAKNLTVDQIKSAKNWESAIYDEKFRSELDLSIKKEN